MYMYGILLCVFGLSVPLSVSLVRCHSNSAQWKGAVHNHGSSHCHICPYVGSLHVLYFPMVSLWAYVYPMSLCFSYVLYPYV
jgi:hypothetical protein